MNLKEYVKEVSKEDFGREFQHDAVWNNRLKTTGGRFFSNDGHLDFNPEILSVFGIEVFRKIVRHELCHYHLYFQGKGYRHRDRAFKELLKKVDGLRYAPSISQKRLKRHYQCQKCFQDFYRQRRIDVTRYRCGKCHGRLKELEK